jgi:hypothetical protein
MINLRDRIGVRVFSHSHIVDCTSWLVLKAFKSSLVLNHVESCEIGIELSVPLHVVTGLLENNCDEQFREVQTSE